MKFLSTNVFWQTVPMGMKLVIGGNEEICQWIFIKIDSFAVLKRLKVKILKNLRCWKTVSFRKCNKRILVAFFTWKYLFRFFKFIFWMEFECKTRDISVIYRELFASQCYFLVYSNWFVWKCPIFPLLFVIFIDQIIAMFDFSLFGAF